MSMNKRNLYIIFALIAIAGFALILSSVDIGGDIVREQAQKAVSQMLKADLKIDRVKGNPFRGYAINGITLVRDGETLISSRQISVKPKVLSLISNKPKLSLVRIAGFDSDVEKINRIINFLELEEGDGETPLEKLEIADSTISSHWAMGKINNVLLDFTGRQIRSDLDLMLDDLPVKGSVEILKEDNDLNVGKLDISVGQGRVKAEGKILPFLDVQGQISELDVAQVLAFWPEGDVSSYEGSLSTSIKGSGSWQKPDLTGELNFQGKKLAGFPISEASSRWRFRENRLDIADLVANPMGIPLKGNLAFVFRDAAPDMLVDLEATSVNLTSLKDFSPRLESMEGMIDRVKIKLQGKVAAPDGQIQIQSRQLKFMGYSIDNSDLGINISRGNMQISGKSEYDKAPLDFSGSVASFMTSPVLDIRGSLRSFNLKNLQPIVPVLEVVQVEGMLDGDLRISGKSDNPQISGKIWSRKLMVRKEELANPLTVFRFSNDILDFSEIKAGWRGASLSGGGKISGLSTKSRGIDLEIRSDGMDSSFFEKFAPVVSRYDLKGNISGKIRLKGVLQDPGITVDLFSSSLGVMKHHSFSNLSLVTSLSRIPKKIPEDLKLSLSASSARLADVPVKNIILNLEKKGNIINITDSKAIIGDGSLNASGLINLASKDKNPYLDLIIKASAIDLKEVTFAMKDMMPLDGVITGEVTVKGLPSDPDFKVTGSSSSLAVKDMKMEDISASLAGNMSLVKIEKLQARAGGGTVDISGHLKPKDSNADLVIKGSKLELPVLTAGFPKVKDFNITGEIDLDFEGHFEEGGNSGSGILSSPQIAAMGIKFTEVEYPISLDGKMLTATGGRANLYGGSVKGEGSLDIQKLKFRKSVDITGTDLDIMLRDAFGIKGHITGKAQLFTKIEGDFAGGFSYRGNGLLKVGEGDIAGFKGISLVAALHGMKSLRYRSVYAPFDLGTGKLILKSDTEVKAFDGDPLYRYLRAEGPVGPESRLDLSCKGNFNIQLLNVLVGGATGGLAADKSIEGLIKGVIQGAGEQTGRNDFRDATFKVGGTFAKPKVSAVKIESPAEVESQQQVQKEQPVTEDIIQEPLEVIPEQPEQSSDVEDKKDVEEQIKEEILKQIFKQ